MNQPAKTIPSLERWTIENAVDLYGIRNWGGGYFDISDKGEVIIRPRGSDTKSDAKNAISMMDIISGIKERGLGMPILLRLGNILQSQITLLHES